MTVQRDQDDDESDGVLPVPGEFPMIPFWYRLTAIGLGVPAGAAGVLAVFQSDNQVGTAALFVVAIALLLVGIQGTPISRFGAGENAVHFALNRQKAEISKELVEIAAKEVSPPAARALIEAANRVEPRVGGSAAAQSVLFESALVEALARVAGGVGSPLLPTQDAGVDFLVDTNGATIAVEAKFMRRPLLIRDIDKIYNGLRAKGLSKPLLIVTNSAGDDWRILKDKAFGGEGPAVRVVEWRGPSDDGALKAAIAELQNL